MMSRRRFYVALAVSLIVGLCGCGGGGGTGPAIDWVVGTWDASHFSWTFSGQRIAIAEAGMAAWIHVAAGGRYRAEVHSNTTSDVFIETGRWGRAGDAYVLYPDGGGSEVLVRHGGQLSFGGPLPDQSGYAYFWFNRR